MGEQDEKRRYLAGFLTSGERAGWGLQSKGQRAVGTERRHRQRPRTEGRKNSLVSASRGAGAARLPGGGGRWGAAGRPRRR